MCQTWRCIIQRIELRIYKEFPQISKRYKQQTVNKQRCKLQICRGRTANGQRLKKRWSDSLIMKYKSGDAVSHPWELAKIKHKYDKCGGRCEEIATSSLKRHSVISFKFYFKCTFLRTSWKCAYTDLTVMMSSLLFVIANIWKQSVCLYIRDGWTLVYTYHETFIM